MTSDCHSKNNSQHIL